MSISRRLSSALSLNNSKLTKVPNTKNECFIAITSEGSPVFIKAFEDEVSAFNEFSLLNFLTDKHFGALTFRVPTVRDFLKVEGHHVIVTEFITGNTAREILLNSSQDTYTTCSRLVFATAEIHSSLSRDLDTLLHLPHAHAFQSAQDIQVRLEKLIYQEGKNVLTPTEMKRIPQLQEVFFNIISREGNGFPCDYYKDSNPANWMFTSVSNQLIAVDFEGNRQLPFWVDLINILEYTKDYLSAMEKQDLIDYYIEIREKLTPNWRISIADYNLQTMYCLFGLYRHHEQMLHRIRDLVKSNSDKDKTFHLDGFFYHLSRILNNLDVVKVLPALSDVEKQNLVSDISEIYNIYAKAINRTVNKEL